MKDYFEKQHFYNYRFLTQFVFLLLFIGMPFFFLGGPGYHGARSFGALWNLGHVLFFALTSWLLCRFFWSRFPEAGVVTVPVYIFLVILVSGIGVEGLQMFFDSRSPSIHDVLRNQLGCLITLVFFCAAKRRWKKGLLILFRFTVLVLIGIALYPLGRAVMDEQIALRQFPMLADFETVLEIDRWKRAHGLLSVVEGIARHGNYSLRVPLTTDKYSGVSLFYFPGNWKGFKNLYVSVYLPEEENLKVVCRVHDAEHNHEYIDRFNRGFILEKGWNDLMIPLSDIKHASVKRLLDMEKIVNVTFFVVRQKRERVIYLDQIYLGK